jgi:hypothetical protein
MSPARRLILLCILALLTSAQAAQPEFMAVHFQMQPVRVRGAGSAVFRGAALLPAPQNNSGSVGRFAHSGLIMADLELELSATSSAQPLTYDNALVERRTQGQAQIALQTFQSGKVAVATARPSKLVKGQFEHCQALLDSFFIEASAMPAAVERATEICLSFRLTGRP